MGRISASRGTADSRRDVVRRGLLALMLLGALTVTLGGFTPLALAGPEGAASMGDDTPAPGAPVPQINPVSPTDATVVRPDEMANDAAAPMTVSGLPASGIGVTVRAMTTSGTGRTSRCWP